MRHRLAPAALILIVTAGAPLAAQVTERGARPEVETVGMGERRVAPDRANVILVIESKAPSANAAASANARGVQSVRDTLARMGLDTAVTTASYHVGVNYEPMARNEPVRSGYVARTSLRVRLGRIDQVGRIIDAGLAKGGTGVEGIVFEASRAEDVRREAMADAAAAARRDAEALARSLGGTLGGLISVSTVGANDPRRMNVSMSQLRINSTQVNPSELVIREAVQTRWEFIPR